MAYRPYTLPTLTAAGTPSGSAVGTVQSYQPIEGRVVGVYFNYSGTATTTNVALTQVSTGGTILSVANSVADGWYYPAIQVHDGTAGVRTWYDAPPTFGYLQVALSQGSAGDTLNTTVIVEF